jgi:hypothetical protein
MANPMPGFIIDVQEIKAGLVSAKSSSPSDSSRSPHSPQHLDCREHESREGDKVPTAVKIY